MSSAAANSISLARKSPRSAAGAPSKPAWATAMSLTGGSTRSGPAATNPRTSSQTAASPTTVAITGVNGRRRRSLISRSMNPNGGSTGGALRTVVLTWLSASSRLRQSAQVDRCWYACW